MKTISKYITDKRVDEHLVTEAAAKDVKIPRKGSTVYLLKDGDSKAERVKVVSVEKYKNPFYRNNRGYDVIITLSDNKYDFTSYKTNHWNDETMNKPEQIRSIAVYPDSSSNDHYIMYVGSSKDVIEAFIKDNAKRELDDVSKKIADAENELMKLTQRRDELLNRVNTEITESLKK